jgi:hypothetical protein
MEAITTEKEGRRYVRKIMIGLVCAFPMPLMAGTGAGETRRWAMNTFEDFRQGTLLDGGKNTYITRKGELRLINLWDFNGDGNFDIPVTCSQDYNSQESLVMEALEVFVR